MKKPGLVLIGIVCSLYASSQATQPKVDSQATQRKTDAGKADVISTKKNNIFDTTTFQNANSGAATKKSTKTSGKKKHCHKKTNN